MATTSSPSVDQYLAAQPSTSQAVLARVRAALRKALPDADEIISYQIPAYRFPGGIVLFFAGWKQHFSIYPVTPGVLAAFGEEIAPYVASKGTLRFPLSERVPMRLITRIAKLRAKEVLERVQVRAKRKASKKSKPPAPKRGGTRARPPTRTRAR